jgi:transposase
MNKKRILKVDNSYLGIDISKDKIDICLLLEEKSYHKKYKNNEQGYKELSKYLSTKKVVPHVCMEATGKYHLGIATHLYNEEYTVSVVNPFKIKSFRNTRLLRNKTDSYDAYAIAEYCKLYNPREWQPDSEEKAELKDLYRTLESYKEDLVRQNNKLEGFIGSYKLLKVKKETVKHIESQIEKVETLIEEFVSENKSTSEKRAMLKTIPGIGNTTAIALLAELPELSNFKTARELAAHIGVTPMHNVSGKSIYKRTSISKIGNGVLRKILYFPSLTAKRHNEYLSDFATKLKNKGKAKMSVVVAVMRKLVHIIYGVLKSGKEYDKDYCNV